MTSVSFPSLTATHFSCPSIRKATFSSECKLRVPLFHSSHSRRTNNRASRFSQRRLVRCTADDDESNKSGSVTIVEDVKAPTDTSKSSEVKEESQVDTVSTTATSKQPHKVEDVKENKNAISEVDSDAELKEWMATSAELLQLLGTEKVDSQDVKIIKDKLFGYNTFWVTGQEPSGASGEGILFLGNLRGNREVVFEHLQAGIKELFRNKYDLFMVEEPNATEPDPRGGPRVSFLLLRQEVSAMAPTRTWQYFLAIISALITAGTCIEVGLATQVSKLPPEVIRYFLEPEAEGITPPDVELLAPIVDSSLVVGAVLFSLQIVHEIGHRLAASRYGVKLGVPYFILSSTTGTLGAITEFKSLCPSRTAKFDVAFAGPVAGALAGLSCLSVGFGLTLSPESASELVKIPSILFQGSLLLGGATRAVLGYNALHSATVAVHPLVIAGWCGLTASALNLLPIGCIDGGRCMQAAYGRGSLSISSILSYFLLGLGVIGGPLALPFGIFSLLFQRNEEKAALNNVSDIGMARKVSYIVVLLLAVVTLLPMWDTLADDLGIGLGVPFF